MLPILELIRLEENFLYGTFGVLKLNKTVFCVTLEPPDLLNQTNRSSIPAQQYICKRITSPKFGHTYQVENVPEREYILFHAGNILDHTNGCIILAEHFGKLNTNERAVLNSGNTFKEFLFELTGQKQLHLTIREVY